MLANALNGIRETLLLEGFMLTFSQPEEGVIDIAIIPGPDACLECLVPKPILEEMITDELDKHGIPYKTVNLQLPF